MKEQLKKYLENQVKKDSALAGKYDPAKLDECVRYINEQARNFLNGQNGYIDDPVVYGWAVHFFVDGATPMESEEPKEETSETETQQETTVKAEEKPAEPAPTPRKKHLGEYEQLDLFGGV